MTLVMGMGRIGRKTRELLMATYAACVLGGVGLRTQSALRHRLSRGLRASSYSQLWAGLARKAWVCPLIMP